MQYTTEIVIKTSISEVLKKLHSANNLKHWQKGLVSTAHISGVPNELGAKMKLRYRFGKREMEVLETVTKQDFPREIHMTYTSEGIRNIQKNYYESTVEGFTKWTTVSEYETTNFKMSLLLFFMPNTFKKQTKTYMTNFKNFVEEGTSIYKPNL